MVVAEVEILQQAKYLHINHAVQNTIQCVFLALLTQKRTLYSAKTYSFLIFSLIMFLVQTVVRYNLQKL